jgi:phenylpropionate dioxygenase-like ring-hydroxylating dioxygenase large terminal subunit
VSFPSSWYFVARSSDVKPGQVLGKHLFGRNLVLWRTESGAFHISDATCPHLGSDLARLGKVKGEHLVCASHQFRYDGAGDCVGTMYGGVPGNCPRGVLYSWPVREHGTFCFAYYDARRRPPSWELPAEVFLKSDSVHLARNSYTFNSDIDFINEDNFDIGHFYKYHDIFDVRPTPVKRDGHTISVRYEFKRGSMISRKELFYGLVPKLVGNFGSVLHGHGFTHFDMYLPQYRFHMEYLVFPTPIAPGKTWYNAFLRRDRIGGERPLWQRALLTVVNEFAYVMAYFQLRGEHRLEGPEYWETKRRVSSPILADEEVDLIGSYREWSKQFMSNEAAVANNGGGSQVLGATINGRP